MRPQDSKAELLTPQRKALFALLDAVAPVYPGGVPLRVMREAGELLHRKSESAVKNENAGRVSFQGTGKSGVAFVGAWPEHEGGGVFSSMHGKLLRAAIEKGLKKKVEDVLVVRADSVEALRGPDLGGVATAILAQIQGLQLGSILLLGGRVLGELKKGAAVSSQPIAEDVIQFLLKNRSSVPLVIKTVSLLDLFPIGGAAAPLEGPKREFWQDLKRVSEALR